MSGSSSNRNRNHQSTRSETKDIGRRKFIRDISVLSVMAIGGASLLQSCKSPSPSTATSSSAAKSSQMATVGSPLTVLEALRKRRSSGGFLPQSLPREKLLELLWAAWGINRPESGKRTAPSAMNTQEIDIYVLTGDGAFVYDAKGNQLTLLLPNDIRTKATNSPALKDAAVQLVFVADYAKFRNMAQAQKELYSAAHTGFIGQNVYLYCSAEGLGAHFYQSIDRAALVDLLKLRTDQAIIFAQAVGYSKD